MPSISTAQFFLLSPARARLAEARYLFSQLRSASDNQNDHAFFLLTVYLDSLLFCLISVEEMVDEKTKKVLQQIDSFMLLKSLRNIAAHHAILPGTTGKYERPIARVVDAGVPPDFEAFFLLPTKLRTIFDKRLAECPKRDVKTFAAARRYLSKIEASGERIMIAELIDTVFSDIESHVI